MRLCYHFFDLFCGKQIVSGFFSSKHHQQILERIGKLIVSGFCSSLKASSAILCSQLIKGFFECVQIFKMIGKQNVSCFCSSKHHQPFFVQINKRIKGFLDKWIFRFWNWTSSEILCLNI